MPAEPIELWAIEPMTVFAADDPAVQASLIDPQTETAETDLEMA
jgi:hypothetical protein